MSSNTQPVVVGYLDNAEGRTALERAVAEAALRDTRLIVVHSSTDTDTGGPTFDGQSLYVHLADTKVDYELRDVKGGRDVAEALVAVADQTHADMIVIGLPRRSPLGKLVLGSHAQQILRSADCPVLAVKTS